jgi:ATP-binding cassette subfamily B protein
MARTWADAVRFVRLLARFRHYIQPHVPRLLLALLASLAFTGATLLEPWPLQILFDGVLLDRKVRFLGVDLLELVGGDKGWLLAGASLAVVALAALRGQFYYAQNVLSATAGQAVVMRLRARLFRHLQSLGLSFHRRARLGDLLMRLTGDIVMLRDMVSAAFVTFVSQATVVLGALAIMFSMNTRLTVAAAAVAPILLVILSVFRVRLVDAARTQRKRESYLATDAHQVLDGIQLVQAYTAEEYENQRFKSMNRRSLRAGVRTTRLEGQLNRSVQIAMAAGICAVLWLGVVDVQAGRLSPGELLVFLAYVRGLYRPLRQISKLTQRMAKASACADRVLEVLDQVPDIQDLPGAVELPRVRGEIVLRNVTFGYEPERPVLRNVSLRVSPGEMVALVGPTGVGKTTILALIPRFYDPWEGSVEIDGFDVRRVTLKSLRRQISMVLQETVVLGSTIRENIAYGVLGKEGFPPPQEKIKAAARAARAHEFIVKLPQGYDTVVGEKGATLSGGQRQRIAIARALLRDAPILLLDEPMTGLDPVSERMVMEALDRLVQGRTTLVVAHHLSTVLRAHRILFVEDGRIVEEGTHEELLARGGRYARFYEIQWGSLVRGAPQARAAEDHLGPADARGEAASWPRR